MRHPKKVLAVVLTQSPSWMWIPACLLCASLAACSTSSAQPGGNADAVADAAAVADTAVDADATADTPVVAAADAAADADAGADAPAVADVGDAGSDSDGPSDASGSSDADTVSADADGQGDATGEAETGGGTENHKPVLVLQGASVVNLTVGTAFVDPGASASDVEDGDISSSIVTDGEVDTDVSGTYQVRYNVTDSDGASADEVLRIVNVIPEASLTAYAVPAMKYMPLVKNFTFPDDLQLVDTYELRMAKGEYYSLAILIRPTTTQGGYTADNSEFLGTSGGSLSAAVLDTYIAKRWFQAGYPGPGRDTMSMYNLDQYPATYNHKWLIQELLLKNEALVHVDFAAETNALMVTENSTGNTVEVPISSRDDAKPDLGSVTFNDSAVLQPFDLVAGQPKMLWTIVHVPDSAEPGMYSSVFSIRDSGGSVVLSVPIALEVLPFSLDASRLTYGIYYTARRLDENATLSASVKTDAMHRMLLQDLKDHGVLYPTSYFNHADDFRADLIARRDLGFPTDRVFSLGVGLFDAVMSTGSYQDIDMNALYAKINEYKTVYSEEGYEAGGLYIYGYDEATGAKLADEVDKIKDIRENISEIKIFASGSRKGNTYEVLKDDLDLAVNARGAYDMMQENGLTLEENSVAVVDQWHSKGKQVVAYAAPQGGTEDSEIYRRNFGCKIWREGYDGAMDWGYQYGRGFVWNDFDKPTSSYRDETMVYQTTSGIVSTVQWEGFRQAVTDVRYLSTLLAIRDAASPGDSADIDVFLDAIDCDGDLYELRESVIDKILQYQ